MFLAAVYVQLNQKSRTFLDFHSLTDCWLNETKNLGMGLGIVMGLIVLL